MKSILLSILLLASVQLFGQITPAPLTSTTVTVSGPVNLNSDTNAVKLSGQTARVDVNQTNSIPAGANTIGAVNLNSDTNAVTLSGQTSKIDVNTTNVLTQSRTYSTNIVLSSATTPVVLGTSETFQWLTIVGNNLGRVANTNTIYLQTQADDGTNGIPVAPGGTVTLTLSPNKFDYLSNYWVGGVVGGAKLFWGY